MTTWQINDFQMANGFYDTIKIREAAGVDSRSAAFDDIFGGDTSDGGSQVTALPAPFDALLAEAEQRNAELAAQQAEQRVADATRLMRSDSRRRWTRGVWGQLVVLGFARHGYEEGTYQLNKDGERLYTEVCGS